MQYNPEGEMGSDIGGLAGAGQELYDSPIEDAVKHTKAFYVGQIYRVRIHVESPEFNGTVSGRSSVSIDNALANAVSRLNNPRAVLNVLK